MVDSRIHLRIKHRDRRGATSPLVLAIAAVAGLILVSCLVCSGLVYFGVNSQVTTEIKNKFGERPAVKENIGEIYRAWINAEASQEVADQFGHPNYVVYDVYGSEGEGQLVIMQGEDGSLVGDEGFLRIKDEDLPL
ncbi:hypothetical protein AB1L30_02995 [Bremerella sp. JC817]|uniref:hypothetical protein n=1 Tax=Bremerella sp. JC817 TaxID=3231756 RepID=UPI00345A8851